MLNMNTGTNLIDVSDDCAQKNKKRSRRPIKYLWLNKLTAATGNPLIPVERYTFLIDSHSVFHYGQHEKN